MFKNNKRNRVYVMVHIGIWAVIAGLSACQEFIEIPSPENEMERRYVFEHEATAEAAVIGMYSQIMGANMSMFNGGLSVYTGLSSDEMALTSSSDHLAQFRDNTIHPTNNLLLTSYWNTSYSLIFQANALLAGIAQSERLPEALKHKLSGESRLVRALYYFYLTNLFGAIPYTEHTSYSENAQLRQTPQTEVLNHVAADLRTAKEELLQSGSNEPNTRPSVLAASALLSRIYIHLGVWDLVIQEATAVIESGKFVLEENVDEVFMRQSQETIWQLAPVSTFMSTAEGQAFIPASVRTIPTYVLSPELLQIFDGEDVRPVYWTANNTIGTEKYVYPFKYKMRDGSIPHQEMNIIVRLSEVYLNRAEARAQEMDLNGALADLNIIRERAHTSPIGAVTDRDNLLNEIAQERAREFFSEWGHRWFDLKRTNKLNEVLSGIKQTWSDKAAWYPLPQSELEMYKNLEQNSGY